MAESDAIATRGLVVKRGDGASPEVFTSIGELRSYSRDGHEQTAIDVTHLTSDDDYMEYVGGFIAPGTYTFEFNRVFQNAQQQALETDMDNHTKRNFQIVVNDDSDSTLSFAALVQNIGESGDLNTQITGTLTLQVSGKVTLS